MLAGVYDGRDEDSGAVDQHVAFDAVDLLGAVEPARTSDRGRLDRGRIDYAALTTASADPPPAALQPPRRHPSRHAELRATPPSDAPARPTAHHARGSCGAHRRPMRCMFCAWLPVTTCNGTPAGAPAGSVTRTHNGLSHSCNVSADPGSSRPLSDAANAYRSRFSVARRTPGFSRGGERQVGGCGGHCHVGRPPAPRRHGGSRRLAECTYSRCALFLPELPTCQPGICASQM
jgi:hypothetical protein